MKKIVSLIAAVAAFATMSISAFAVDFTGDAIGATIDNNIITYDAASNDVFVFKYVPDMKLAACTLTFDVTELVNDGWTISELGADCAPGAGQSLSLTGEGTSTLVYKWTGISSTNLLDANGSSVAKFTAKPGANSKIDGVKFTVSRVAKGEDDSKLNKDPDAYTLAKAAPQEDKTTATIDENGEVTFVYADADKADAKLDGKKVVLSKTAVAGNKITADTTVAVTYTPVEGAVETKTFGETLFSYLAAEGLGFAETESITFGVVCDANMSGTFTFALN